ncbi:MAG TPA: protein kinase, partial [Polyangiaceae bacterium]|nr:protein kinase [Polyangiaceae bacterium]
MDTLTLNTGMLIAGKLRVVREIGVGGMGAVYEVEHELTKHRRALKVLHPSAAQTPSVVERFLREASAAGRVGNSHIAETFDAGKLENGEPYLLMELLDGETLDQQLQRQGAIDPGELADLIYQACEGMQAAHDAGIVHRDLKPENLIVTTRDGAPFVKILDFGISKFDAERTGTLGLTQEGLVMGTPYYMSPEQVRGASLIDARTDVYALGVILYECACGVRPYEAAAIQHLAVLIHEGKPTPLAERRPSLPPAFCSIVHRAMAVDREQRFESARALAAALAPLRRRTLRTPESQSDSPRLVVRPSRVTGEAPVSVPLPSTDAALAATMATGVVPAVSRRGPALGVLAVAGVLVLAGGVFMVTRFTRGPSATATPSGAAQPASPATQERESHPPSVILQPLPAPEPSASA